MTDRTLTKRSNLSITPSFRRGDNPLNFRLIRFATVIIALLMLDVSALVRAATLKVAQDGSEQYAKIQSAVDAASNGDTVVVADGTYSGSGNRDIDFHGKSLTVKSQNGPTKTIIDCGGYKSKDGSGNHRGFFLHSSEKKATISGFTIKNGYEIAARTNSVAPGVDSEPLGAEYGGGVEFIDVYSVHPFGTLSLTDCIIFGNTASYGGGVYNKNGWNQFGFGKHGGTITLTHCVVSGNTALLSEGSNESQGGGIYNSNNANDGEITLTDCTISENLASAPSASDSDGGGVYNDNGEGGTITLTNCTVSKNHASGGDSSGGGIENRNFNALGKIAFTNCAIFGNTATAWGGGIYNGSAASDNGGMVTLTRCTVCDNAASRGGGGMYDSYFLHRSDVFTLTHCIFFGDKDGEIANDYADTADALKLLHAFGVKGKIIKHISTPPIKISVTSSDIQGKFPGIGNINADPLFADASAGDFHLKPGSPCLGMGGYGAVKP